MKHVGNRSRVVGMLGLICLLGLSGCHQETALPPPETYPPAHVRTQMVAAKTRMATEEVVGTVRAKLRAVLAAKVSGRIARMPVVAGQTVQAGELLAQLDAQEIRAKLDQAKAVLEQAERDRRRFEDLLKQKAVTQQEFDAVDSRFRVAQAAQAEVETMLGYTTITAPFAGVITRKLADQGDLATPGRPLLELEDPHTPRFETDISEALISRVHPGAKLPIRIGNAPTPIEGVVSEIAPAADPNTRTFRVKLDLPKVPGLRLGQFGRVAVPVAETTAPRVPATAVVIRGQMELVFVVTNQTARLRLVKTGKQVGAEIEILSGITAGDQVVVSGAETLRDGQPVVLQ